MTLSMNSLCWRKNSNKVVCCIGLVVWFSFFSLIEILLSHAVNPDWYGLSLTKVVPYVVSAGLVGMSWFVILVKSKERLCSVARLFFCVVLIVVSDIVLFSVVIAVSAMCSRGSGGAGLIVLYVTLPYMLLYHGWHKLLSVSVAIAVLNALVVFSKLGERPADQYDPKAPK